MHDHSLLPLQFEPCHSKTCLWGSVTCGGIDQMISIQYDRHYQSFLHGRPRVWSDSIDSQADLRLLLDACVIKQVFSCHGFLQINILKVKYQIYSVFSDSHLLGQQIAFDFLLYVLIDAFLMSSTLNAESCNCSQNLKKKSVRHSGKNLKISKQPVFKYLDKIMSNA